LREPTPQQEEVSLALPAVIDLQGYREQRIQSELRQALHEELERWLDRLEEVMDQQESRPRLWEMTETIREQRQELMAQVAKVWVQKHYAQELQQERAPCPQCGRQLRRWGLAPRVVETLIGTFTLQRPYFSCRGCQAGFCPLDTALGLAERDKQ
jgi:uncharacterized protein with PIN domain